MGWFIGSGLVASRACHTVFQNTLDKDRNIESYIDLFNESDEIDGFTDCDLFESGYEKVQNPISVTRDLALEVNQTDDEILSGQIILWPPSHVRSLLSLDQIEPVHQQNFSNQNEIFSQFISQK